MLKRKDWDYQRELAHLKSLNREVDRQEKLERDLKRERSKVRSRKWYVRFWRFFIDEFVK